MKLCSWCQGPRSSAPAGEIEAAHETPKETHVWGSVILGRQKPLTQRSIATAHTGATADGQQSLIKPSHYSQFLSPGASVPPWLVSGAAWPQLPAGLGPQHSRLCDCRPR